MGNKVDNKFTWVIKNFSSLKPELICSDQFVIGGCKWRLLAYPKGNGIAKGNYLSLCLGVADSKNLPCGWRRQTKYRLTVVNQLSEKLSQAHEAKRWFDQKGPSWIFSAMLPLTKLHAKDSGFLVNNEVKIVAEVDVVEVIGKLDVSEESDEATQPLKKLKREDGAKSNDLLNKTQQMKESIDVNGFQVLPSQVGFVRHIFEKHPDIALEFRVKNQHLRTACMNVLNLIETMCQSLQELSYDDLVGADNALAYLRYSGIKVDWLEQKLEEVEEKKKEEQIGETRMQELEEELKGLKRKCSDIEALLGKEKAKVLAARASPLTLDDVL